MTVVIVVPCFNEALRWKGDYWSELIKTPDVRWLFVNDGSTDATQDLIDGLCPHPAVQSLTLPANAGKAEAVRQGLLEALSADPEAVGFMDADGAFNVEDIRDMVDAFHAKATVGDGASAVWASRVALSGRDIRRSLKRHYLGRIVATYVSVGQGPMPYDTQAGLKLFVPSPTLVECLRQPFKTRWLFELELLARWQQVTGDGMQIWELPLNYWHDVPGSKIRGREVARIARELLVVKSEQRKARRSG